MDFVYGSFETDFDDATFYILPTLGTTPSENGTIIFIGCFYWFIGIEIHK